MIASLSLPVRWSAGFWTAFCAALPPDVPKVSDFPPHQAECTGALPRPTSR
jgi:hypothetical protein